MKKIYYLMLLMAALICLPWSAKAEQLNEGFESETFAPEGWANVHSSGTAVWARNTTTTHSSSAASAWMNTGTFAGDNYLITPKLAPEAGEKLTFWVKLKENANNAQFIIEVSTTTQEPASFTNSLIAYNTGSKKTNPLSSSWAQKTVDLSSFVGQEIYIAFHVVDNYGSTHIYLDDVAGVTLAVEEEPSDCPNPKSLAVSNLVFNGATFTWAQGAEETQYQWACVAKDAEVETWNDLEEAVRTKTISGLTSGASYDFYVRSYCDAGEGKQSTGVKKNFTPDYVAPSDVTVAEITSSTANVSWTANSGETAWTFQYKQSTAEEWNDVAVETTPSYQLTDLTANTAYQVRVVAGTKTSAAINFKTACGAEALPFSEDFSSSIDCWTTQSIDGSTGISSGVFMFSYNSNPPQYLISPELTASAKEVKVTFDYRARSASYPETFQVGYSTTTNDVENAFTWGDVVTSTNTTAEKYEQVLPADVKYVAIKYTADNQWALYIDNFSVAEYEAPACEMPTGLAASEVTANSAKIAWTSEATAWKLQTSADGDHWTDVEGEITNPYTLNALTENTKYYVRVCANCGANGDSEWTAAINFTTECAVKSLPLDTVKFESGMPACWSAASQWAVYTYEGHSSSSSMRFNASTTADLTLPVIALNDKAQLTFWRMSSSVSCSVYVNDGESETNLGDFAKSSDWTQTTVDLSAYAGKTVTIIIRGNYVGSYRYLYIDDVTVNYAPVAAVNNVEVTPADGKATVAWECAEEGVTFNLQYREKDVEPAVEWTEVKDLTAKTYTIGNLTNGQAYEVQVKAVASANRQSEWTESAIVTPINCPSVQSVTFGAATYNSVVVNWTANAAGTWSLRYQAGDNGWSEPVEVTENTYTLTNLEVGIEYSVQVKASCASDEAYVSAAAPFIPAYSAPASATVADATDVTAVATWDAVADAPDGYKYIVVARGAEVDWTNATATDALTAELSGLSGLTDYDFYVAAVYGENLGTPVKAEFATIAYAPKNLAAGEITTTTATFTWEANGAATRYQWSTDGEIWSAAQEELTATATGLKAATTYTFYVRSYYAEGKYSEPVTQAFTTACDTYTLPFEENFENAGLPNCWESEDWSESVAAGKWSIDNTYSHSGFTALRFNANTANSASISTPEIALGQKAELSFFLRNVYGNNAGYVGGKVIAADVENEENKVEAEFIQSNAENLTEQKLDLSELLGKTVKITFLATGVSASASLYIDDVKVTVKPDDDPTAIGNTSAVKQVIKTIENDQMVIIIDGVKYNAQGQKL